MADPVTLAVVGGTIGAATSKDPLKGALLGAVGGYTGGSMLGAGAAAGSAGAGIAAQPAMSYAGSQLAGAASPGLMSSLGSGLGAASQWMNQNPMLTQMGMGLANNLMSPEPAPQFAPAGGVQRGGGAQQMPSIAQYLPQQQQKPISLI